MFQCEIADKIEAKGYKKLLLDQLNSKYNMWAKYWKVFVCLKTLSGWGFDEMTGMLTALEDCWMYKIVRDLEVSQHCNNSLKYYSELCEVFKKVYITGYYM